MKRKTYTQTSLAGNSGVLVTPVAALQKLQQALNECIRSSHRINTGGGGQQGTTGATQMGQRRRGRPPANVLNQIT